MTTREEIVEAAAIEICRNQHVFCECRFWSMKPQCRGIWAAAEGTVSLCFARAAEMIDCYQAGANCQRLPRGECLEAATSGNCPHMWADEFRDLAHPNSADAGHGDIPAGLAQPVGHSADRPGRNARGAADAGRADLHHGAPAPQATISSATQMPNATPSREAQG